MHLFWVGGSKFLVKCRCHETDLTLDFVLQVKATISGGVNVSRNETEMAQWLMKNGPISIGINANAMQFYMGGISHPWKFLCSSSGIDHGVLIVGFGKGSSINDVTYIVIFVTGLISSQFLKYGFNKKIGFLIGENKLPQM